MKSCLLNNKIKKIQEEYLKLLIRLLPKINSLEVLDEIKLFWYRNKDIMQIYLETSIDKGNSYFYSSANECNYEEKDYFPFLLIGKDHLIDDPLVRYLNVFNNVKSRKQKKIFFINIKKTVENNIKLLSNTDIMIFPLSMLINLNVASEAIIRFSNKIFFGFFDDISNIDEYYNKCKNIDDIICHLRKDIYRYIMLSPTDNIFTPLEERFKSYKIKIQDKMEMETSDTNIFFTIVYGYIKQSVDIMFESIEYRCIPFITHKLLFHYILLISYIMTDIPYTDEICYKLCVGFTVYNIFDKERFSLISVKDLIESNSACNFDQRLFDILETKGVNKNNFLCKEALPIIKNEIQVLFNYLLENALK